MWGGGGEGYFMRGLKNERFLEIYECALYDEALPFIWAVHMNGVNVRVSYLIMQQVIHSSGQRFQQLRVRCL